MDVVKLRRKVRYSTAEHCHYCGIRTFAPTSPEALSNPRRLRTHDHIVPKCRGGGETVLACNECNNARGDAPYEMFKHWSHRVASAEDMANKANAFRLWMYTLAMAAFRVKRRNHPEFRESWSAPVIVHEKPTARGRYSRRELRSH